MSSRLTRISLNNNGTLLICIAVLFWAGNLIVGRLAVGVVPPVALAFYRWLIGGLIALVFAWPHLRRDWPHLLANWHWMLIYGAFGIAIYNTLVYVGLTTTTAINAFLINTTVAPMVAVASFVFFGERIGLRAVLGLVVALSGVVWIILRGDLAMLKTLALNPGDFLVLIGVATYAIYTVFLRKRPPIHGMTFITVTFLLGSLMLLPFFLWEWAAVGPVPWGRMDTWLSIGYLAIFPSLLSYLCFNRGVHLLGANRASALLLLTPLLGVVLAMVFLKEQLIPAHIVGAAMIFFGLFLGRKT